MIIEYPPAPHQLLITHRTYRGPNAGVERTEIGTVVSVVVACVTGVSVAVVVFGDEVQPAIRRPQSKRLRKNRGGRDGV